ncbi:unnamed protein product [Lactuca virosa]|uniref:Uncharacterized protein n=1 Tax=Lactuca virosa TaxID=75947 RepID=A0AAU9N3K7_9ASTR|nr:unnamed protein product [Lactuca virosa]
MTPSGLRPPLKSGDTAPQHTLHDICECINCLSKLGENKSHKEKLEIETERKEGRRGEEIKDKRDRKMIKISYRRSLLFLLLCPLFLYKTHRFLRKGTRKGARKGSLLR